MATKHTKMTDDDLLALLTQEKSDADVQGVNLLSYQREVADRVYAGTKTDDLRSSTNMSSVIMNATRPVVNTLTTHLTKIFASDKETVVFAPTSPEKSDAAKQAAKLVNQVIHKENNGYQVINEWARSAAVHKNAVVKVTWDDTPVTIKQNFPITDEMQINTIAYELEDMGAEVEIVDQDENGTTLKIVRPRGLPTIEVLPPEEFLINEGATAINDPHSITRYVAHRKLMFIGDVQALADSLGVKVDVYSFGTSHADSLESEYETLNRHSSDGTYNYNAEGQGEGSNREVEITEVWYKCDKNGDGINEWIHAFHVGNNLIFSEEWDGPLPFVSFTYFPIAHKFYGLSVWDVLKDYHKARTGLMRSEIDMRVQQNTFRLIADPRFVDQRMLQSGRPGIIPARPGFSPANVMPITPPSGSPNTVQLLELLDREIEKEIGINPLTGAISADVEKSGNDAAKTSMVIDNASSKVEEYARRYAEAWKEVTWLVFDLLKTNGRDTSIVALVDKVTPGQPFLAMDQKLDKSSLIAKVGLGHMNSQQKVQAMAAISAKQLELETTMPGIIPVEKKLNVNYELTRALGYENVYDYFPTPDEAMKAAEALAQQQPQPDPLVQAEVANKQADTQLKTAKVQEVGANLEMDARKQALEEKKVAAEIAIETTQGRGADIG